MFPFTRPGLLLFPVVEEALRSLNKYNTTIEKNTPIYVKRLHIFFIVVAGFY